MFLQVAECLFIMRLAGQARRKHWLLTAAAVVCAVSLAAAPRANTASANTTSVTANAASATFDPAAPPPDLRMGDVEFRVQMEPFADTYVGMTHFDTRTVQIDPASQADERRRVYLHELMHVAWHQGHPSADKSRKFTEEEAIQALAPGLLKLLEENPQAVEYLQKSAAMAPAQDKQLLRTTARK